MDVLKPQADEIRESLAARERAAEEEQRLAQASKVFIWEEKDEIGVGGSSKHPVEIRVRAYATNGSDQPVYDAELYWHRGSAPWGQPNPQPIGTIMPGQRINAHRDFPGDTNMDVSGAVLMFRDAANVKWIRRPDSDRAEQQ